MAELAGWRGKNAAVENVMADKGSLEKENAALRKEVNALRAKLGLGRKYVEWKEKP